MKAARDSSQPPRRVGAGGGVPGGGRGPLCRCASGSAGEPAGLLPGLPHAGGSVRGRPCRRPPASPSALRPYTDSKARCPCSPLRRPQAAAGAARGACSHESLGWAHGASMAAPPKPPTTGSRPPRRALRDRQAQASYETACLWQQDARHGEVQRSSGRVQARLHICTGARAVHTCQARRCFAASVASAQRGGTCASSTATGCKARHVHPSPAASQHTQWQECAPLNVPSSSVASSQRAAPR